MNTHDKGLRYCKVCKKAFDQKDHIAEHEESHITSGKRYKCIEKLPNDTLCGCQYKACGSLQTHINNVTKRNFHKVATLKMKMSLGKPSKCTKHT